MTASPLTTPPIHMISLLAYIQGTADCNPPAAGANITQAQNRESYVEHCLMTDRHNMPQLGKLRLLSMEEIPGMNVLHARFIHLGSMQEVHGIWNAVVQIYLIAPSSMQLGEYVQLIHETQTSGYHAQSKGESSDQIPLLGYPIYMDAFGKPVRFVRRHQGSDLLSATWTLFRETNVSGWVIDSD